MDSDPLRPRHRRESGSFERGVFRAGQRHRPAGLRLQRHRQISAAPAVACCRARHFRGIVPARAMAGLFTDENIYAIIILGSYFALRDQRRHGQRRHHGSHAVHHPDRDRLVIGCIAIYKVSPEMIAKLDSRRLGEPVLRVETWAGLDGHSRQGQRRHSQRTATNFS